MTSHVQPQVQLCLHPQPEQALQREASAEGARTRGPFERVRACAFHGSLANPVKGFQSKEGIEARIVQGCMQ